MNITIQTTNTIYRSSSPVPRKRTPKPEIVKKDYDTVNIHKAKTVQEDDESFARILARKTAAQINDNASQEKVMELSQRIADGTYQPDAQRIAGRLLGLG